LQEGSYATSTDDAKDVENLESVSKSLDRLTLLFSINYTDYQEIQRDERPALCKSLNFLQTTMRA